MRNVGERSSRKPTRGEAETATDDGRRTRAGPTTVHYLLTFIDSARGATCFGIVVKKLLLLHVGKDAPDGADVEGGADESGVGAHLHRLDDVDRVSLEHGAVAVVRGGVLGEDNTQPLLMCVENCDDFRPRDALPKDVRIDSARIREHVVKDHPFNPRCEGPPRAVCVAANIIIN